MTVTLALSTSLTTMLSQIERGILGVVLCYREIGGGRRVVERACPVMVFHARDRRCHAIVYAGRNGEVAVEVGGRDKGHTGQQGIHIGNRAAGASKSPLMALEVRGYGTRSGGTETPCSRSGDSVKNDRDVGAVDIAHHDVG